MGSMIHLAVGRLEVDWGKNMGFQDHSLLFQETDVNQVPYYYVDEGYYNENPFDEDDVKIVTEYKEGLSKPLGEVVERINLLGHTLALCEKEFLQLSKLNDFDPKKFSFRQLQQALATVDVQTLDLNYGNGGEDFGKFFRRELFTRLGLVNIVKDARYAQFEIAEAMENLSAYTILTLLAANPSATYLPVIWAFNDLDRGGWAKRSDFIKPLDQNNRFLIVTEGSSDAAIIRQAFELLKPHVSDFFHYVDMAEGYPFSGTGNLLKFIKGLISISVQNNVIALFDNDTQGVDTYNRCQALNMPENMRALKLPELDAFKSFPTIGPSGPHNADINGQAVAIECYLNLDTEACVRWNNYNKDLKCYQGELINKEGYARKFLSQRKKSMSYDYTKIEAVLDTIVEQCTKMQETRLSKQYDAFG